MKVQNALIVKAAAMDPEKPIPIWAQKAGLEAARRVANLDIGAALSKLIEIGRDAFDEKDAETIVFAALGIDADG